LRLAGRHAASAELATHLLAHATMYLVREITCCKPGTVRPMGERSLAMAKLMEKQGQGKMRVMTDFVADRY
jgi:hypothetical protein